MKTLGIINTIKNNKLNRFILNLPSKKFFYLIFCLSVIMLSLVFCIIYLNKFSYIIDDNYNLIFKKIPFGNGLLIHNIIYNFSYEGELFDKKFIIQKLPVLPILIAIISKISSNFYFIIISKNLILFSLLYYSLIVYLKSNNFNLKYFYILIFIYCIPYNLFVSLNFEYADSIIAILLPSLFLILLSKDSNKFILSAVIFFLLYLTKNSTLFICICVPIYVFLFDKLYLKKKIKVHNFNRTLNCNDYLV